MASERLGKRERASTPKWLARIAGAHILALSLVIPTTQSLAESEPVSHFNSGPMIEIPQPQPAPAQTGETYLDTGLNSQACRDFGVCGTDLGIPFRLPPDKQGKMSVGYLFGDTLTVAGPFLDVPPGADNYRPQVMLRSSMTPEPHQQIIFDSAAGLDGTGIAPELLHHGHMLTNDALSLPTGDIVLSYQKIADGQDTVGIWATQEAGLAISHDNGNTFELMDPTWGNNGNNSDPYQMWSMERDGDYVNIVSVRSGRQPGPMMLSRVRWDQISIQSAYEYWNGSAWGTKDKATPIQQGIIGEPSLRKLSDGKWALAYAEYTGGAKIITHTADSLEELLKSPPKVQLTWRQLPSLYGGFIHPDSTESNLILMVSSWQRQEDGSKHGKLIRYDVSHLVGSS